MKEEVRMSFLPYCLQRQPDGRYAILNRRYKPVGMAVTASTDVPLNDCYLVKLAGLTPELAAQMSADGAGTPERVHLYADARLPTAETKHWAAYSQRLLLLARLTVSG